MEITQGRGSLLQETSQTLTHEQYSARLPSPPSLFSSFLLLPWSLGETSRPFVNIPPFIFAFGSGLVLGISQVRMKSFPILYDPGLTEIAVDDIRVGKLYTTAWQLDTTYKGDDNEQKRF